MRIGEIDKTIREVVHVSQGGKTIRLSLTNEFGILSPELKSVHVALHSENAGKKIAHFFE